MRLQKSNQKVEKERKILTPKSEIFLFLKALNRKFWAKYFQVYDVLNQCYLRKKKLIRF